MKKILLKTFFSLIAIVAASTITISSIISCSNNHSFNLTSSNKKIKNDSAKISTTKQSTNSSSTNKDTSNQNNQTSNKNDSNSSASSSTKNNSKRNNKVESNSKSKTLTSANSLKHETSKFSNDAPLTSNKPVSKSSSQSFNDSSTKKIDSTTKQTSVNNHWQRSNSSGKTSNNSKPNSWTNKTPISSINKFTSSKKSKVIIPTIIERLNSLDTSELLSQNNISSLSSYYSDYSSAKFKNILMKDLLSTNNVSITNINYNASKITSITVRNNTLNNVILEWSDGTKLLILGPKKTGSIGVYIVIINKYSFVILNRKTINLTVLWHKGNVGIVDYYDLMWRWNYNKIYKMAAVYGILSTKIDSLNELNNLSLSNFNKNNATIITSSVWTTYYDSKYNAQLVKLSWISDILGMNSNGFEGYEVYIINNSTIGISKVKYYGTWYDVNYKILLGGRFSLNYNDYSFKW